eukprot:m.39620 g.39620  ORF g.39620 m.39620 type:complete len:67 (-) comp10335_c0_seq1:167-367(-)
MFELGAARASDSSFLTGWYINQANTTTNNATVFMVSPDDQLHSTGMHALLSNMKLDSDACASHQVQ